MIDNLSKAIIEGDRQGSIALTQPISLISSGSAFKVDEIEYLISRIKK